MSIFREKNRLNKMGFFERHKALIITVLLFSVLLLAMYNINMSNTNKKVRETLIQLENLRLEEPEQPEEQEQPQPSPQQQPGLQTHQAFNQEQEESQQNTQSRLDEIFERNSARQEASEEETANSASDQFVLQQNRRENRQRASEGNNNSEQISTQPGSLRNSSIAFSLMGRSAIHIPNPIYTCETLGKIVVNIKVNEVGRVIDASVNQAASSSSNECLTERALEYAAEALFSELPGRTSQPGTITYYFQGQ